MELAIFGAQGIALGACEAIRNLSPSRNIRCFLVSERGMNAQYLSGIPVLELNSFSKSLSKEAKKEIEILIATPENVMPDIEKRLDEEEFSCHVRLTSSRWSELMGYHYICKKDYMPLRALPVGHHKAKVQVFMAKFYKDRPLTGKYDLPEWITPIQAGAALCEKRVADITDCSGEHISEKNGNYSELTVLYWMWKNCLTAPERKYSENKRIEEWKHSGNECGEEMGHSGQECCGLIGHSGHECGGAEDSEHGEREYYGLMHYRRILDLTEDDIFRLADNDLDVVLPYPMPYEPDIEMHHARYLKPEDWKAVWEAVAELQPAYAEVFRGILKQRFLYNYNIIVARKNVLAEYCGWLFPILERVEELSVPRGSERADRYIGYIGETLETLYFMHNRDRLNISHAGCIFLS